MELHLASLFLGMAMGAFSMLLLAATVATVLAPGRREPNLPDTGHVEELKTRHMAEDDRRQAILDRSKHDPKNRTMWD